MHEYSFLIHGASGFTAQRVATYLAKILQGLSSSKKKGGSKMTYALSGRNKCKIEDSVVSKLKDQGLPTPGEVIEVDNNDVEGLIKAVGRAKLCLNCTGPYKYLGAQVVEACISAGTDYIDLCGEPEVMERFYLDYHEKAKEAGVLIISAAAFDSVPADMGVLFAQEELRKTGSRCSSITSYITIQAGEESFCGHSTTFDAAVHGYGSAKCLSSLRKQIEERYPTPKLPRLGPKPTASGGIPFSPPPKHTSVLPPNCMAAKFPGADSAVVRRTAVEIARRDLAKDGKKELTEPIPYYCANFILGDKWSTAKYLMFGGVFQVLATKGGSWGRSLLLKYPRVFTNGYFSHDGPTERQMEDTTFSMVLVAEGYSEDSYGEGEPTESIVCRVSGPEPGYIATSIIFVTLSMCLLDERKNLPAQSGVYTPGPVFTGTSLIDRLQKAGVSFTVEQQTSAPRVSED